MWRQGAEKRPFQSHLFAASPKRGSVKPRLFGQRYSPPPSTTRQVRRQAGGVGRTRIEALVACIAEATERYSIQWQGDIKVTRAQESCLGADAISLRELGLWSTRQARNRSHRNGLSCGFSYLPAVPRKNAEIDWVRAWSLTNEKWKHIPAVYCFLDYPDDRWFADSNGCAAGNVVEEAILHGFLELVERDAIAIWWYNRVVRPRVIPDDRHSAAVYRRASRSLATQGRMLEVMDLTTDFAIPAFAAVSARKDGTRIAIGTSASLNAARAFAGAIRELFLTVETLEMPCLPVGAQVSIVEVAIDNWKRNARLEDHPYLIPEQSTSKLSKFTDLSSEDLRIDVEFCVERAARLGLEVLMVDVTRPDIKFPVVRVIAPGMRPCWGRFAPGRLFEVPVKMGWRQRKLREAELNPHSYFL
jgi:thiazole/oxazole-forming peptide maturase SagD family component